MRQAQAIFDQFKAQTGDTSAAAMLTLAAALLPANESKPLTVKQAAERKGVSVDLIYDACKKWKLKHRKLGRKILIEPDDLDRFSA